MYNVVDFTISFWWEKLNVKKNDDQYLPDG